MSDDPRLIDKRAVAAMLGVTTRQIERYAAEAGNPLPIAVRAAKGSRTGHRYDIRTVYEWGLSRLIEGTDGEMLNLDQERARLTKIQRERQALALARERGELVAIEQVADAVGEEYTAVRARLLAIPTKAAPMLAHESSATACRAVIDRLVREALDELSAPGGLIS